MARKRKELPLLSGVEIVDVAAEGNSIARVDEMVVFIPFGAPGDIADVKIDRKKRSYAEGHIEKLTQPSAIRVEPRCEHFTMCGGCRWQHLPYEFQLKCKQKQVEDALQRIAKIPFPELTPILGSESIWEYRNKMEYTFSNKKWLTFDQLRSGEEFPERRAAGFHISGAFDKVLDINKCHLQDDLGNRLRLFIKRFGMDHDYSFYDLREQHGLLRTLMIRISSTGEVMAVMVFGEDDAEKIDTLLDAVAKEFPEITSLLYVVNTKVNDTISDQTIHLYKGKEFIEEEMEGLRFRVGPKSFYQTNSRQAYKLYSVAREFARLTGEELVYDLYTGTGTIACFVARNARHVIGIEYVPEAIEDAKVNAGINKLDNTEFYAGDMKNVLTSDFIAAHGRPDVMIVDPPRAGMHEDVVKVILDAAPRRIVYVSCNPATQARDLALLHVKYDIDAVQPVDMFPHTQHVENVVALSLRDLA
ncbi:MAG: 23S rRNA (uracil(1939)-C(5))-methyltransferase RlmD [Duncaniella sp.]|uniref:23S rRNA (uracil(1939)-C(5))-methyltransferase RlmD n=1 Tax=Duncaniella sp. TaxID=2518496 RepID=UPI0023D70282|nr:23S rRNA (uracil(1939)-C(5))-methyltransferase RlmD [Duncaniella sp.]MDE5988179.1 23S rRNA (uracil(1939)-C(5))-methyltransferase RlmD [Duncaniella sp.]